VAYGSTPARVPDLPALEDVIRATEDLLRP